MKELWGSAAGIGFVSWTGVLSVSSTGGLAAVVVCSLATSAKGVRGCFGVERTGALATGFGAGRVYTMSCQPKWANTWYRKTHPLGRGRCSHSPCACRSTTHRRTRRHARVALRGRLWLDSARLNCGLESHLQGNAGQPLFSPATSDGDGGGAVECNRCTEQYEAATQ